MSRRFRRRHRRRRLSFHTASAPSRDIDYARTLYEYTVLNPSRRVVLSRFNGCRRLATCNQPHGWGLVATDRTICISKARHAEFFWVGKCRGPS